VNVELADENDHEPVILFRYYPPGGAESAVVEETKPNGTVVAVVTVTDADAGDNGRTSVRLAHVGNELGHFRLEQNELFSVVRVNTQLLSAGTRRRYNLTVIAVDHGNPPRTASRALVVFVRSANETPPVFEHAEYTVNISEVVPVGSYVVALKASPAVTSSARDRLARLASTTPVPLFAGQEKVRTSTNVRYAIAAGNELGTSGQPPTAQGDLEGRPDVTS